MLVSFSYARKEKDMVAVDIHKYLIKWNSGKETVFVSDKKYEEIKKEFTDYDYVVRGKVVIPTEDIKSIEEIK